MTRMLKEAILLAGENVGNQLAETAKEEQKGLVSYLVLAAMKQPAAYMALLGRIMPMQVEKTEEEVDVPYKTVEEVKQALRDRGLPVERIYPMLEFAPIKQDDVEAPESDQECTTVRSAGLSANAMKSTSVLVFNTGRGRAPRATGVRTLDVIGLSWSWPENCAITMFGARRHATASPLISLASKY
jgi:hypothetical protein